MEETDEGVLFLDSEDDPEFQEPGPFLSHFRLMKI